MKYILIRDDDLNYHTTIEELTGVYSYLFDNHIPINFATIPAVNTSAITSSSDFGAGTYEPFIPKEVAGVNREWAIDENGALIAYLRNIKNAEFLLHGYAHFGIPPAYEFENDDKNVIMDKLAKGKEILQRAFGQIPSTFVAPQDKYSPAAFKIIKENFEIFSLGWIDKTRIGTKLKVKYNWMKLTKNNYIKEGGMAIFEHPGCLFSKFKSTEETMKQLDHYIEQHKITIIVTHHWEFYEEGRPNQKLIDAFVSKIKALHQSSKYQFITFSQLAKIIKL